jgi:hypothetical protein
MGQLILTLLSARWAEEEKMPEELEGGNYEKKNFDRWSRRVHFS